jgi:serine/threonine-protein kinase
VLQRQVRDGKLRRLMSSGSHDPLIGTRLDGRYLIREVLGRGGMGVVYAGVHEKLAREVAIKVLGQGLGTDSVASQRFLREARIASNLSHGNIVDVSDLGHLTDGRPYLVMPRVNGVDFAQLLAREGALEPARVVELLRGVASALDLVHAKGLVHRDVKPENLMHVVREDGSETVMLLDFGIATLLGPETARLTADGRIVGTPAYLPPELVSGENTDHRGDIYALATVAFELITGRLPYLADNPMKLLPMKMSFDAPRMSLVTGRDIPERIEAVVARGLARDPARRQATAGELVQELDAAVRESAAHESDAPGRIVHTVSESPPSHTVSEAQLPQREAVIEDLEEAITLRPEARSSANGTGNESGDAQIRGTSLGVESSRPPPPPALQVQKRWLAAAAALLVLVSATLVWNSAKAPEPAPERVAMPTVAPAPEPAVTAPPTQATTTVPPAQATTTPPRGVEPPPSAAASTTAEPPPRARPGRPGRAASQPKPNDGPQAQSDPLAAVRPAEPTADELNKQAASELVQGHLARAADLYQRASQRDPRNAAAFRGLGVTSERLGRREVARNAYQRALKLTPPGPQADSMRARLEQLQGP